MAGVPKGRNTSAKGKPEGSMKEEEEKESGADGAEEEQGLDTALFEVIKSLKKGQASGQGIEYQRGRNVSTEKI